MSQGAVTLIVGALLAVGALAFVLYPLFFHVAERPRTAAARGAADDSAIVALREIEFDRATGKLSEADYAELRSAYSQRALAELRATRPAARPADALDPIEARVREFRETHRSCATCGVRPEPDAVYCSTCGGFLDAVCPSCAARIAEPAASFCSACGTTLASAATA